MARFVSADGHKYPSVKLVAIIVVLGPRNVIDRRTERVMTRTLDFLQELLPIPNIEPRADHQMCGDIPLRIAGNTDLLVATLSETDLS